GVRGWWGCQDGGRGWGGGGDEFRKGGEDPESHIEDVLGLRSDALLVRWTNSGTLSGGAGPFERTLLVLWTFGTDGRLTRWEQRDVDHDAEALARFEEFVPSSAEGLAAERARPTRRPVRLNAATAIGPRMFAAFDAHDADPLAALCGEGCEIIHHPTGTSWEREGFLASSTAFFAAQAGTFRLEPLATLGDSLGLCRQSVSASGIG